MTMLKQIEQLTPHIPVIAIQLPEGHSLSDMWLNYGADAISELINDYQRPKPKAGGLEILSDYKISYQAASGTFFVIGQLPMDLGKMYISLQLVDSTTKKHRFKIDLYDFTSVENQCRELSEKQGFDARQLEADLTELTDLLEQHREKIYNAEMNPIADQYSAKERTPKAEEKAMEFLKSPKLMANIDSLLEQAGIIGEQDNRKIIFVAASSYKMPNPLHTMVQGSSGSGKSHTINTIAETMPQEDVLDMTRITSKSLYHYKEGELMNKLVIIQDFDGVDEQAQYAFREIQTHKKLSSSTAVKDMQGNTRGKIKTVHAHFASVVATTKAEVYLDNMSRSIMLGVDESEQQTLAIIKRQNMKKAGLADKDSEHQAKQLLRNCMRVLKSHQVVNPFADKLMLPLEAKMLRRLNEQFQDFVCQITLLHQYQRKTDAQGRLVATKEDVRLAVDLFFSAIILKVDELDSSTRQFFERLKAYVHTQPAGTTHRFSRNEIRNSLRLDNSTCHKYFTILKQREYIQQVEGSANRGYRYVISYNDDMEKAKAKVRKELNSQLDAL